MLGETLAPRRRAPSSRHNRKTAQTLTTTWVASQASAIAVSPPGTAAAAQPMLNVALTTPVITASRNRPVDLQTMRVRLDEGQRYDRNHEYAERGDAGGGVPWPRIPRKSGAPAAITIAPATPSTRDARTPWRTRRASGAVLCDASGEQRHADLDRDDVQDPGHHPGGVPRSVRLRRDELGDHDRQDGTGGCVRSA